MEKRPAASKLSGQTPAKVAKTGVATTEDMQDAILTGTVKHIFKTNLFSGVVI